jgi:membrane protein required for colicin V production
MDALIWIDWVIIALIAVSTLISLKRGFVREALSLVTWVGAFIIARTFHPQMQSLLESTVETPLVRLIAAFAILFFGTLIVGAIINNMIGHLVRATGLSATDRVLGMGRTLGDEFARFLGPEAGAGSSTESSTEQEGVEPAPASR